MEDRNNQPDIDAIMVAAAGIGFVLIGFIVVGIVIFFAS